MSTDAMEAICWGELISFGTNKHPPLSGWIMSTLYTLTAHSHFITYLCGQICLVIGFFFTYKVAKFFLSEEKAIASAMILEACSYYTWMVFINSFNCNILLMALWPIVIYYFYKSIRNDKLKDWLLLAITFALAFLGKYQIVFLFGAMFLYLIFFERCIFKRKGFYLSAFVAFILILPHIIWLINNDFFSFAYMLDRTESVTKNLPIFLVKIRNIFYPIKFVVGQLIAVAGCIALYLITALKAKNISIENLNDKNLDKYFLLMVGLGPIILHGLMGLFTGSRIPSVWGSIMVCMVGILLFYFLPIKFEDKTFNYFVKWIFATLGISAVVIGIFMMLQTKVFISYPYQKIVPEMEEIWSKHVNDKPLKYIAGEGYYIFPFRFYNANNPKIVLQTFGHKNPWVDYDNLLESGVLVMVEKEEDLDEYVRNTVYFLPENYKITHDVYSFEICNSFNKCSKEEFYYAIIPPKE